MMVTSTKLERRKVLSSVGFAPIGKQGHSIGLIQASQGQEQGLVLTLEKPQTASEQGWDHCDLVAIDQVLPDQRTRQVGTADNPNAASLLASQV